MATGVPVTEQLLINEASNGGNILTLPSGMNVAIINVTSGGIRFTLDATDPATVKEAREIFKGQSLEVRDTRRYHKSLESIRIIPIRNNTRLDVWYYHDQ